MKHRQSLENGAGTKGHPHVKKKMSRNKDTPNFMKINSKQITDFCVNCKTIKVLEDNVGQTLGDRGSGDDVDTALGTIQERNH